MMETKPFKTKLCVLYRKGHCGRQTCTFAHGDSEIRPFSDRRNSRGNDLRNKLDRRRSPLHRYSPVRDARDLHGHQRLSPSPAVKRRKYRTLEHMDGQSDLSRSFKLHDGMGDRGKDRKLTSSESTNVLEDELKQLQYEVDVLFDRRSQLEIELEERIQKADSLSSRVQDFDVQLSDEKDKCRRVHSDIKKLIRAHVLRTRLQDDLKRSQIQLDMLVEDLGLDAAQLDSNIISDEEVPEQKKGYTSPKKQLNISIKDTKGANIGDREVEMGDKRPSTLRWQSKEGKSKRKRDAPKGFASSDKSKVLESNIAAPPTSMAAHALDDFVEQMEAEEKVEVVSTPDMVENGLLSPLPPVPSVSHNNYYEYQGDNENVDVDGLQEEFEEVDIV